MMSTTTATRARRGFSPGRAHGHVPPVCPAVHTFLGRFKGLGKADILTVDAPRSRMSRIISAGEPAFTPHGLYAY